jgi:uncharacterized protein (DUF924 family)
MSHSTSEVSTTNPPKCILTGHLDILKFWFGDDFSDTADAIAHRNTCEFIESRMPLWFGRSSPDFEAIQISSKELVESYRDEFLNAISSGSETSPMDEDANSLLAKIIVFDQFPRSIYRGTGQAFAFDPLAQACARRIVSNGWYLTKYSAIERLFIILAFQHAEDLDAQELGLELAKNISFGAPDSVKAYFTNLPGFPMEHYEVFIRFSRYPSRNLALGRESTKEEVEWMQSPECPTWARSQLPQK